MGFDSRREVVSARADVVGAAAVTAGNTPKKWGDGRRRQCEGSRTHRQRRTRMARTEGAFPSICTGTAAIAASHKRRATTAWTKRRRKSAALVSHAAWLGSAPGQRGDSA